jgi:hypothetical protein
MRPLLAPVSCHVPCLWPVEPVVLVQKSLIKGLLTTDDQVSGAGAGAGASAAGAGAGNWEGPPPSTSTPGLEPLGVN